MLDLYYDKDDLGAYLLLAEFREDLTSIKNSIIILEKQNKRFLESLYYFSSRYQKNNPEATIFDLRPRKNIQFLLSSFFVQMLRNLTKLQSQFTSKRFLEITRTIENSAKFFTKSKDRQARIKDKLDFYINVTDKILINFFGNFKSYRYFRLVTE